MFSWSCQILFTSIFTKYSAGISSVSSTFSSFSGVSSFIIPVTLFSIFSIVVSMSLYTKLIFLVILISSVPLKKVSILFISCVHVIVLFALLYVPCSIVDFSSSISNGNSSTIVIVAFPIYLSIVVV